MIGFFILRRLIELHKISSRTKQLKLNVFCYNALEKDITSMNAHKIFTIYDLSKEIPARKNPTYISNQFIHACTSYPIRDESRNWCDIFVVSDYDRNDCIWRVPISEIRKIFMIASDDYPQSLCVAYNKKIGDYVIKAD